MTLYASQISTEILEERRDYLCGQIGAIKLELAPILMELDRRKGAENLNTP